MSELFLKKIKNKKILITGGAGFIGSHLSEELLNLGANVICFDDLSTGKKENIAEFSGNARFKFVKGDANKLSDVRAVFGNNKIDFVFHYAARVGVIRTTENPLEVFADLDGIKNILELSRINNVKKVIFASSSEVYGEPVELPEREDGPLNIHIPYATVKLAGEQLSRAYYDAYGLKTCSLRFFNVYGPKQDSSSYGFVMGIFIKNALEGKPFTIFGKGNQTRDFVFVKDNVKIAISALFSDKTNGEAINIGRGKAASVLDVANMVRDISGKKIKFIFKKPHRGDAVVHRNPSIIKLKKLIGITPKTILRDGIKATFEWNQQCVARVI